MKEALRGVTTATMILAKEAGIRFPEHFKKGKSVDPEDDLYDAGIYYFRRPEKSFEMSYLTYWNGARFRGGYIIYENNYSMPGKGRSIYHNGITVFAEDTKEIRNIVKKARQFHEGDEMFTLPKGWVKFNFLLYSDQLHYWGIELHQYLDPYMQDCISKLMDMPYDDLLSLFDSYEKNKKPELKYVAALPVFVDDAIIYIDVCGENVSQAWKLLYKEVAEIPKIFHAYLNIDEYHRSCHYYFKKSIDFLNVKSIKETIPIA